MAPKALVALRTPVPPGGAEGAKGANGAEGTGGAKGAGDAEGAMGAQDTVAPEAL